MILPAVHFSTPIALNSKLFSPSGEIVYGRIASPLTTKEGRLWVRKALESSVKTVAIKEGLGSRAYLIYDNLSGSPKVQGKSSWVFSYVLLPLTNSIIELHSRVETTSASGQAIGESLQLVYRMDASEYSNIDMASGQLIHGKQTERVFYVPQDIPDGDFVIKIDGQAFRITSVTPDKNLFRINCLGV